MTTCSCPHLSPQRRILNQILERIRKRRDRLSWNQPPCHTIDDNIAATRDIGRDRRPTNCRGFDDRSRGSLSIRRETKQAALPVHLDHVSAPSPPFNMTVVHPLLDCFSRKRCRVTGIDITNKYEACFNAP